MSLYNKFAERNNAVCAILYMIDSSTNHPSQRKDREQVLEDLIQDKQLAYTEMGNKRLYTADKLNSFITILTTQLKKDVEVISPRYEPIWQHGSRVIQPNHLKKIDYEGYVANLEVTTDETRRQRDKIARRLSNALKVVRTFPAKCSCWEGFCDREDDDELFEAPKGYYCTSCLENAEAESMLKDIGGCSNPKRSPKCQGKKMKKIKLYDNYVLCTPCHNLLRSEKKLESRETSVDSSESPDEVEDKEATPLAKKSSMTNDLLQSSGAGEATNFRQDPARAPNSGIIDLEDASAEESQSAKVALQLNEPTHKRANSSTDHAEEPGHKRQRGLKDELHRTGDTGVGNSHVEREMADIFKLLSEAVLHFHQDTGIKPHERACIIEQQFIGKKLGRVYGLLTLHDTSGFALLQDGVLTSYDVLLGLLGGMLYSEVFNVKITTQTHGIPDAILKALRIELSYDDDEMVQFQNRIAYREICDKSFEESYVAILAQNIVNDLLITLMPHLQLAIKQSTQTATIRTSKWLPDFKATLIQAMTKVILLKARFLVTPAEYSMVWHKSGSVFDRTSMKDFNEAPIDRPGTTIAMTLLPGWSSGGVVVSRARVKLDIMQGEIQAADAS